MRPHRSRINLKNAKTIDLKITNCYCGIHLNDLGQHTLYLVLKNKVPIGFVHARTELGQMGAIELIWAMDLDLSIVDFRVQRSRERRTDVIKSPGFRQKIVGRSRPQLRGLLTLQNASVNTVALEIGPALTARHDCGI